MIEEALCVSPQWTAVGSREGGLAGRDGVKMVATRGRSEVQANT